MKAIFHVMLVVFAMDNLWASAQQYTVHACKNGIVLLSCRTGLIQVSHIVLGDSRCSGSSCCPRQDDCSGAPSSDYRNQVTSSCNGQQSCSTYVEIRDIGCGFWGPRNDYSNITYSCTALETSTFSSSSTRLPTYISSTPLLSSTTRRPTSISRSSTPLSDRSSFTTSWQRSTPSPAIQINTTPPSDIKAIKYAHKPDEKTSPHEPKTALFVATPDQNNDHGSLDRVTLLLSLAVIVGGVVITAIIISVAVVFASKKRRMEKTDESYDMPNFSCSPNNDDENVRNSNFYDFIPDPGNGPAVHSDDVGCTAKENDYLTPVIESEEAPYLWIA